MEQVPAVCDNKNCTSYQAFELVDLEDCTHDPKTRECTTLCPECGTKILIT